MPEEKETRNRTSANGEGGCKYIESKGLWCARITIGWEMVDGKKKQTRKAFYGKTKKDALEKVREAQVRVQHGEAAVSSTMKLSEWADKWVLAYCSELSPRTVTGYKSVIKNQIKPEIGNKSLKELKPIDIKQMITNLISKGYSKSHVNRARVLTNDMLEDAADNNLLIRNPCRKIDLPPMPKSVLDRTPFTSEEEIMIFEYAPQYFTQSLPHKMHRIGKMIIILLRTGLRQEEILALQWRDVDFKENVIWVRHAVTVKKGKPILKEPKTESSKRKIPMHPIVKLELKSISQGKPSDFIFGTASGNPMTPRNFQRDYKKFFESANANGFQIGYKPPHVCRHTFASDLRAKGRDLKTISILLGHSRIQVTDIYTHTTEKDMKDSVSML